MTSTTTTNHPGNPPAHAPETPGGLRLYFALVAVQTTGAVIALTHGVPIYRQITRNADGIEPHPEILWWAVAAVVLIQTAYWLRVRLHLPLPQRGYKVLGTFAYFVARLNFTFASSTFALVFLSRFDQLHFSAMRIFVVMAMLFSLFCYTLELERLARAIHGAEGKS
ncbi:MAG: hypothetical protein EPO07_06290 [Verrucomicrobia bacterium]|nr:MAG: hypothetical protein EPO07_06290 [Verrucomicrobiota bacterium]